MARKRLVTRTIESTVATCDVVLKNEKKLDTKDVIISGTFDEKDKLAKAVEKELSENETLLGITDVKVKHDQRAMAENDFIKYSYVIKEGVEENA